MLLSINKKIEKSVPRKKDFYKSIYIRNRESRWSEERKIYIPFPHIRYKFWHMSANPIFFERRVKNIYVESKGKKYIPHFSLTINLCIGSTGYKLYTLKNKERRWAKEEWKMSKFLKVNFFIWIHIYAIYSRHLYAYAYECPL